MHASLTFGILTAKYTRTFVDGPDLGRLGLSVAQPLTDSLTLEGGVGFRNRANFDRAYDYNIGVSYDFGNNLSASAMISGAQYRKTDGLGRATLILGVSQSF